MPLLFGALLLCLALLPARAARADSAPLKALGPGLQPLASTTVRMEAERIEIHLGPGDNPEDLVWQHRADVKVWFRFVPEADESMLAGFPLFAYPMEPPRDFKVSVGGKELSYEERQVSWNEKDARWAVWHLDFHKGEPLEVEVRYWQQVNPYGKAAASDLLIGYVLRTGAFWAGTIGRAEATISLDRPIRQEDLRDLFYGQQATTPGWQLKDGALYWDLRDLEPEADLQLQMANTYWLDLPAEVASLVAKPALTRDDLVRMAAGMKALYGGGTRDAGWAPVRGGQLSGDAANALLPGVMAAFDREIAAHPEDAELRSQRRLMLRGSLTVIEIAGNSWRERLTNPAILQRYAELAMAEYKQYGDDLGEPKAWAGWLLLAERDKASAAVREAALQPLLELLPKRFRDEADARDYVQRLFPGETLLEGGAAQVLRVALQRIDEQPAPAIVPAEPVPPSQPDPPAQPEPLSEQPRSSESAAASPWLYPALGVLALAGATAAALLRRRSRRQASHQ
jgi:hypothetical protein